MTPKEKAKELVDKYFQIQEVGDAKRCALIAVDEVVKAFQLANTMKETFNLTFDYWKRVKEEINNL